MATEHYNRWSKRRPFDHAAKLAGRTVTPKLAIDTAWRLLAPAATLEQLATILFDGRPKPFTVRAWRMGKRTMPSWARDLLHSKMQAGLEHMALGASVVAACPVGVGAGRNIHDLKAWHMRQAAIRNGQADPNS